MDESGAHPKELEGIAGNTCWASLAIGESIIPAGFQPPLWADESPELWALIRGAWAAFFAQPHDVLRPLRLRRVLVGVAPQRERVLTVSQKLLKPAGGKVNAKVEVAEAGSPCAWRVTTD